MALSARSTPNSTPGLPLNWRQWPPEAKTRYLWRLQARPQQLTPPGDWYVWLILSGRGWGKTRTGAEDLAYYGLTHPGTRLAVVASTSADARDTCVEGESGLLRCIPQECIQVWNRSLGELVLVNGTRYKLFSADEPERLRGPQHHRAWCDELGSWRYSETFDMLQFGLRLGDNPQVVVTTTPRPIKLIKELMAATTTVVTRGSTFDNADNLAPSALAQLRLRYAGTRMGRQELEGEYLEDVPGALWQRALIDDFRVEGAPEMYRIVVAIDPAVTSGEDADDTGIVVAGAGVNGHGYVLADRTCKLSSDGWARRALVAYSEFKADRVVAEVNNGGDLVERVLRMVDPHVAYSAVHASRGKRIRAEPVAALYEQGKIHHVGGLADLEDQMCNFVPEGGEGSPDRVDALVWALTELFVDATDAVALTGDTVTMLANFRGV